jgi:hypothetical protein
MDVFLDISVNNFGLLHSCCSATSVAATTKD